MKKAFYVFLGTILAGCMLASCSQGPLFTPLDSSESGSSETSSLSSMVSEESMLSSEISEEPEEDPYLGEPVPESDPVDESYFNDAVFIGDSLTYGLGAYQVLDADKVIAHTGINPQTILTSECIEQPDGSSVTVLEAVEAAAPKKVYIMLGSNGVAFLNQSDIIEFYGEFIDELQAALPDAIFYVESVLPVTHEKETEDDRYANSKIDALNEALQEMAASQEVYYLDVAEAIKDENGCLPTDLSADGMHFGISTYETWVDYLLSHTVDETLLPD